MCVRFFLALFLLAMAAPVGAQPADSAAVAREHMKASLRALQAEYRAHSKAHSLIAELGFFDEFNTFGRTVVRQVQEVAEPDHVLTTDEREPIAVAGETVVFARPSVEAFDTHPLLADLRRDLAQLRTTIAELERAASSLERKKE